MNGSSAVDFADLIDYSALGDENDPSASYAAVLENSMGMSPHMGGATAPSAQTFANGLNPSFTPYSAPPAPAVTGYAPAQMSSAPSYPTASTSASLGYSAPYVLVPPASQSSYYNTLPSVDPSSFFTNRSSNPPPSSTLAMQSQLIQDERNRANRNGPISSMSSTPFYQPSPSGAQPSSAAAAATTVSPAMMTNAQFPPRASSSKPSHQPVASTSKASPPPSVTSKKVVTPRARSSPPAAKPSASSSSSSEAIKRWNKVLPDIRNNLTSTRLSRAPTSAAQRLIHLISPFNHVAGPSSTLSDWSDGSDVPPEGRREVLTDLLKYAGEDFWKAWVQEGDHGREGGKSQGIELLSFWFEGASRGLDSKRDKEKDKAKEKEPDEVEKRRKEEEQKTLALILQVFAKLPISGRHLANLKPVASKLRKFTRLKGDEGAVKAAASRLFDKWMKVQADYNQATITSKDPKDAKTNGANSTGSKESDKDKDSGKRKSASSEEAVAKKAKITSTTTTKETVTKKPSYAPVNPTKVGSMSFKKNPSTVSSTQSAMRAALATVAAKKNNEQASAAAAAATATGADSSASSVSDSKHKTKVKKTVRWKPDENLEAIRWIEKAIYDDDGVPGRPTLNLGEGEEAGENFREMEQQEGMTLAMHLDEDEEMEEEMEWYSPVGVVIPENEEFAFFRQEADSSEARIQTEREATLMQVDTSLTPFDSPTEPPEYAPAVPDPDPKVIPLSPDLAGDNQVVAAIASAQAASVPQGGFAANDQIESLLGQLNTAVSTQMPPAPQQAQQPIPEGVSFDPTTLEALKNYDVDQIKRIIDSRPAYQGMTVENLGLEHDAQHPPPHHNGVGAPAPVDYGYSQAQPQALWGQSNAYGTAWRPGNDNYHGYVPPQQQQQSQQPSTHSMYDRSTPVAPPSGPFGGGSNGPKKRYSNPSKRKTVPCRYFQSKRGCDWGDKCAFIHDNDGV